MAELDKNYNAIWVKVSEGETEGSGGGINGDPEGDFRRKWGWYVTIDEITMGDVFKEDELFGWSCVRFLNRIAYLKHKNFVMSQNG